MEMIELSDANIWLIAGGVLLCLEFTLAPAIGFLFLGIGAVVTGFLVGFGIADTTLWQWIICLAVTIASAILLWKPMKTWRTNPEKKFNDMVGDEVEVLEDIKQGKIGSAKWNGATMKAKLAKDADSLKKGVQAEIVELQGNVLVLK